MRLEGADFVAIVRISSRDDETLAAPGQTCERVPAHLLALFEQRGNIKRIAEEPLPWRSKVGFQVDSRHNDKIPLGPDGEEGTEP